MSSEVVIHAANLSKCYQIYDRPSDRLKQFILSFIRRAVGAKEKQYFRSFWANQDISFDIIKGETVGIIGRNGSGKSTLLEMICGTLRPTSGVVGTVGKVAALLELGSGFNMEFSGKENVFLNATVLGLSQAEIQDKYAAIVAFADIGEFIDQPVKTYSSGMLVRLAFAVIAHVDADILIIDEALSVGDAIFTQKCMRFLREHMKRGSLLFVSHDTNSVLSLCQRAIWLNNGRVEQIGPTQEVVDAYTLFTQQKTIGDKAVLTPIKPVSPKYEAPSSVPSILDHQSKVSYFAQLESSTGWVTGKALITGVRLLTDDGRAAAILKGGERVQIVIDAKAQDSVNNPILGWFLKDRLGQSLFGENTFREGLPPLILRNGDNVQALFQFVLPLLPNGEYSMTVAIAEGDLVNHVQHHWLHDAVIIKVESPVVRYGLVGIPFERVELNLIAQGESAQPL
jgi:lipopolysaccharide transport system ATP-binding protein